MIGVVIIVVVFTAIAVALAWGAGRGKLKFFSKAVETESRAGKGALNLGLVFTYLAFGLAVPVIFILGNRDNSNAQVGGLKLTAAEQSGRELFGEHCAVCHTLDADNAVGHIGPNLDTLKPPKLIVLLTIKNGCLQQSVKGGPTDVCLGYGTMPADIVQGQQAEDIAAFVARVAGHT
jgi:mono/diheme cytochrome c family protein